MNEYNRFQGFFPTGMKLHTPTILLIIAVVVLLGVIAYSLSTFT